MRLCPRSARELGQPLTEDQAREWCARVFDREKCDGCGFVKKTGGTMRSFVADEELAGLAKSGLHVNAPYIIRGVSTSQFSVSRHFGGCQHKGSLYTYVPDTDELVRDDVLKWIVSGRKKKLRNEMAAGGFKQGKLF